MKNSKIRCLRKMNFEKRTRTMIPTTSCSSRLRLSNSSKTMKKSKMMSMRNYSLRSRPYSKKKLKMTMKRTLTMTNSTMMRQTTCYSENLYSHC